MSTYNGSNGNQQIESNRGHTDSFSSEELRTRKETQAGAENLRDSTIDASLSTASTRADLAVEQRGLKYEKDIHTLVGFLSAIDKLLEEVKDTRKGLSKKGLSKAGKKTIDNAKKKLKQYEKQLKGKRETILKQAGREITDSEIGKLRELWTNLNKVREEIGMGQRGDYASTASYLYNSPEIARKSNKYQAKDLEFRQNFQQELKEGAILNIFNGSTQKANEFLRRIAQGEYTQADYQLYIDNSSIINPYLQKYGIRVPTNPSGGNSGRMVRGTGTTMISGNGGREMVSGTVRRSVDYSNMDFGEAFQQGGISGCLDKILSNCTNMTSGQKDTWKNLAVLGGFAGGIYGLYKFYTSKKSFVFKAGVTAAAVFGTQAVTGEGPISIFSKLLTGGFSTSETKNKYGDIIGRLGRSGSEVAETTVPSHQSMMIFNSGATVGDVQQITRSFRRDNTNRRNFYNQSCDRIKREYGISCLESFQATFSNNFDEEKWNKWLESFGVTGSTDNREKVHELAYNAEINKTAIEKFLADNKLKITNDPVKKAEFDNYIRSKNEKNESIELSVLEAHKNDWFVPTNPSETDTQNPENVEIKKEIIKPAVDKGLSTIFSHFKNEYGFIVSKLGINQSSIQTYSPGITTDIISNICKTSGKTVTLDLSDNNIKQVYNNFINKFASTKGWPIKGQIQNYNRDGLKSKLNKRNLKGETKKVNKRKNNFSVIFDSLFKEIIPVIQSQGGNIKIVSNGADFSTVNDAIDSLQILNNP